MNMQHKFDMDRRVSADALRKMEKTDEARRIAVERLGEASRELVERQPKAARWYCLQIATGREFAVEKLLAEADVMTLLPTERVIKIRCDKKFETERAFFPGYLLVRCVPSPIAFHALRKVKYVIDIVGDDSRYHVVADEDVRLFEKVAEGMTPPRVTTDKTFTDGDRANIVSGPFAGFSCLVVQVKWSRMAKAKVRIDLNSRSFDIESMPLAFLEKL